MQSQSGNCFEEILKVIWKTSSQKKLEILGKEKSNIVTYYKVSKVLKCGIGE